MLNVHPAPAHRNGHLIVPYCAHEGNRRISYLSQEPDDDTMMSEELPQHQGHISGAWMLDLSRSEPPPLPYSTRSNINSTFTPQLLLGRELNNMTIVEDLIVRVRACFLCDVVRRLRGDLQRGTIHTCPRRT